MRGAHVCSEFDAATWPTLDHSPLLSPRRLLRGPNRVSELFRVKWIARRPIAVGGMKEAVECIC